MTQASVDTIDNNTVNGSSIITSKAMQLLWMLTFANTLAFATYQTLLNNFVIEKAAFTGAEIGILQSLREVPGFLAFTAIFILWWLREQTFALLAMILMGIGVALTGYFPSVVGLYLTTVLMSVGFHYFETVQQSMALQWLPKSEAAHGLGKLTAARSGASILVYVGIVLATTLLDSSYNTLYLFAGSATLVIVVYAKLSFPQFENPTSQKKSLVLRKKYWLYYALTFMGGARRQIFTVFAGFLMVEKFGYSVSSIALLFLINHIFTWFFAARIGSWIGRVGEGVALRLEYTGLSLIFLAYAVVDNAILAAVLYVLDHLLFAMAIAIQTYFQKIVDPEDIASSSGVSFTINHIAAVFIPALFGLIWLQSPATVFVLGAVMAVMSLLLACNVPAEPSQQWVAKWKNME